MKILEVDVGKNSYEEITNDDFSILGYNIREHLDAKTYNADPLSPANFITFNSGVLTGQGLPGAHRLIVVARSPLTRGFFFSTVGGVGEELYRTGFDVIKIKGRASSPSVVLVRRLGGKLLVNVEECHPDDVFKLQEFLVEKYKGLFKGTRYRAVVAGASGFHSVFGGLSSVRVINDSLDYGSEGFAGRGGFGSVLAQAHNIAGIMIGGDLTKKQNPAVKQVISNEFGDGFLPAVSEKTAKYRGKGTFMSNYEGLKTDALMFNWQSTSWSREKRIRFYDKFINNYTSGFSPKSKTCGEACPALCKKVEIKHVTDYEPFSSCGPNLGIFSRNAARELVNLIDSLGFDAISAGNLLSTLFEGMEKGRIDASEFGVERPSFDPDSFSLEDSEKNSRIAQEIIRGVAQGKFPLLGRGIRKFSESRGVEGVYFAFGSEGVISPNEYLRPGFIAPLPILGKFTTYYKKGFVEPRELGKLSAERLIRELFNEDTGFCRFHRGWAEKVIPPLVSAVTGREINYYEHIKNVVSSIISYNSKADSLPRYWPNKKTEHLVHAHLLISSEDGDSPASLKWKEKFNQDFDKANKEYWNELIQGVGEVLGGDYLNAMGG